MVENENNFQEEQRGYLLSLPIALLYCALLYPRYKVYRGYIVFAFSVIMFVCLSVCLFVCL